MSFTPGGGGGGGNIATASDSVLNNPTTNDGLVYDAAIQKWKNVSLNSKVTTPSAWASSTSYKVGDFFIQGGVIFRTEVAHTSTSTTPSVALARPTDPSSNYSVWAAPGNSPGSLVVRSSTNEVTLQMLYVMNSPSDATSVTNKQYVDAAIASAVPQSRPPVMARVVWNGSGWTYRGSVITARPGDLDTGDGIIFIGNPGGTLPAWAAVNDLWTQG